MTISVWRYSHLTLAVSSFIFLVLAAMTGIILAFEPIAEKQLPYKADRFDRITLAEAIPALKATFEEVTDLSVDANQFVTVKGIDTAGRKLIAYVDPATGKILGIPAPKSEFFQWVRSLHRSLFLHETGRFMVGLTAFLLMLIAISGTILVIKRQRGWKRFFARIVKDNFFQTYHVILGRLSLLPIVLIAMTGTYLSLVNLGIVPEKKLSHHVDAGAIKSAPAKKPADFAVFRETGLTEVQAVEFPFSPDPEDYYTIKLKDREILVNQITGEQLSEIRYPAGTILTRLSMDLHTGRTNRFWTLVLAVASLNILFFIYSGFAITLRRLGGRVRNKYKADECAFVILAGSENGSTMRLAKAIHQQLIAGGQRSYMAELNDYRVFPRARQLVILTSTHGKGNAPSNANRFESLLAKYPQPHPVHFSVVGFGSHAYPDFCKFAYDVNNLLSQQDWARPALEIHTINDRSPQEFNLWLKSWTQKTGIPEIRLHGELQDKPADLQELDIMEKTESAGEDIPFVIRLRPAGKARFSSGDLLAVYPGNDHRERFYSIGKLGDEIQLAVKLHPGGLGSNYLYEMKPGMRIQARILPNAHFRFPRTASSVIMISNGTGIAPFLGMIHQEGKETSCHLYCGFRGGSSFEPFKQVIGGLIASGRLKSLRLAYSREGKEQYVCDLLEEDADQILKTLANKGVLMLCGSLSMQHDVLEWLESACEEKTGRTMSYYQSHGQILMDCY